MNIELVDWMEDHCPVVFDGKVYQLCFVFDGGIVLTDDITGTHCFRSDNDIEAQLRQVKHISVNGHLQFGGTSYLQGIIDKSQTVEIEELKRKA